MEDRQLSLSEVAGLMGVSERTVRRWIKSGKLRAYKPGRDYRIPESAFQKFVAESEISPKERGRSLLEPSLNDVLEEERRTGWESAVENARRLRKDGRERLGELLSTWRASKEAGETYDARRGYLDAMGTLLQQAYDAETALLESLSGTKVAAEEFPEKFREAQKADRFYIELWHLVQDAGLSIRTNGKQADERGESDDEQAVERVESEKRPTRVEEDLAA
jgi:excisionase family DNA binding protein